MTEVDQEEFHGTAIGSPGHVLICRARMGQCSGMFPEASAAASAAANR